MRVASGLLKSDTACPIVVMVAALTVACGKKGPPLPPLVKIPIAPAEFAAERRGEHVQVQFRVPAANTDGSKPANIERIEVYRFTGPSTVTDAQILKLGTRVASIPVRAPRNPDVTTEPDEPEEEPDLEHEGLDPGSLTRLEDQLDAAAMTPVDLTRGDRHVATSVEVPHVLVGPPPTVGTAIYVAVGINRRGRRGPLTTRARIPLVPPPKPPFSPQITYDETTIRVAWTPSESAALTQKAGADLLPSRAIGSLTPTFAYHVYDVSIEDGQSSKTRVSSIEGPRRLSTTPVAAPPFEDKRIAWGATRCYTVRTVETIGGLTLESEAPPAACTTLEDTFPPVAPKDLRAVARERSISLAWEANSEKDLGGYIVSRGAENGALDRLTPAPIPQTSFDDAVQAGARYVYAVQAVDTAGNVSAMSNRVEETAR